MFLRAVPSVRFESTLFAESSCGGAVKHFASVKFLRSNQIVYLLYNLLADRNTHAFFRTLKMKIEILWHIAYFN